MKIPESKNNLKDKWVKELENKFSITLKYR